MRPEFAPAACVPKPQHLNLLAALRLNCSIIVRICASCLGVCCQVSQADEHKLNYPIQGQGVEEFFGFVEG